MEEKGKRKAKVDEERKILECVKIFGSISQRTDSGFEQTQRSVCEGKEKNQKGGKEPKNYNRKIRCFLSKI